MIRVILFAIGSAVLAVFSRRSLPRLQSHGFYRFFAWEALLGLFLLVVPQWFQSPLAWYQLISWIALAVSLGLAIEGFRLLRQIGQPGAARVDGALLGLEKTSRLVTVGVYRFIRHPLYSSLLFLAWGMFFKSPSVLNGALSLLATALLTVTARVEEAENVRFFGQAYADYMQRSRMFIPWVL